MKKLHTTQSKLLELLKNNNDNPLTIRELGSMLGVDSPGVVHHHLVQLEKKGYVKKNPQNPKDYIVMDSPDKLVVYIGKYGMAQCGPDGLILDGNIVERIPIASSLLKFSAAEAFIVEARGDSMEPNIKSGDIIIAKRQKTAEHGDTIVCVYKEEAMIKQLWKIDGDIFLYSFNHKKHPQRRVIPEELQIEGIVKNILNYG